MEILGFGFPAGEAGDKSALRAHGIHLGQRHYLVTRKQAQLTPGSRITGMSGNLSSQGELGSLISPGASHTRGEPQREHPRNLAALPSPPGVFEFTAIIKGQRRECRSRDGFGAGEELAGSAELLSGFKGLSLKELRSQSCDFCHLPPDPFHLTFQAGCGEREARPAR